MNDISSKERQQLGILLKEESQESIMARIPQFFQAEIQCLPGVSPTAAEHLGILMFNMERGVHLAEIIDFLRHCPAAHPYDVILANELDDGCARSDNRDVTRALAEELGFHAVFGLEFIELVNPEDAKGHHGNAIFSRWPIRWAKVLRLPEEYNWYFDRQQRIGSRCAVFAELDVAGQTVGVVSIHLENRTNGQGRQTQMAAILQAAEELFPDMPVILGGDLNTNSFDGRDKEDIGEIAASPSLRRRCLENVFDYEPLLPDATAHGYSPVPDAPVVTRRKPLLDGSFLPLRLDWILLRGATALESRMISTRKEDCGFAPADSALAAFAGEELSDHNAVWALCRLDKSAAQNESPTSP